VTTAADKFIWRAAAAKLPESMTRQNTRIECSRSITPLILSCFEMLW